MANKNKLLSILSDAEQEALYGKFACWYPGFSMDEQSDGKVSAMAA
ncbi:hypothetical protein [Yersinia bercovieri]|nr:hypothetical protein [Yersinia bercovieri]